MHIYPPLPLAFDKLEVQSAVDIDAARFIVPQVLRWLPLAAQGKVKPPRIAMLSLHHNILGQVRIAKRWERRFSSGNVPSLVQGLSFPPRRV